MAYIGHDEEDNADDGDDNDCNEDHDPGREYSKIRDDIREIDLFEIRRDLEETETDRRSREETNPLDKETRDQCSHRYQHRYHHRSILRGVIQPLTTEANPWPVPCPHFFSLCCRLFLSHRNHWEFSG